MRFETIGIAGFRRDLPNNTRASRPYVSTGAPRPAIEPLYAIAEPGRIRIITASFTGMYAAAIPAYFFARGILIWQIDAVLVALADVLHENGATAVDGVLVPCQGP
jgi:hypothetical protein